MFQFSGNLEISKSWMNRALILQSFDSNLQIFGKSNADDVVLLQKALEQFKNSESDFYIGLGGTTFRFLALRVSRKPGQYLIRGDKKLFLRPQSEIINILQQFGVMAAFTEAGLVIKSKGWQKPLAAVKVLAHESSQFLSALALSAVDLDFDFEIAAIEKITSSGYFQMTLDLLKFAGIKLGKAHQKINIDRLAGEVDISSAFSLISAGVLNGSVHISNWNSGTSQPDRKFLDFFKKMNIQFQAQENIFIISKQDSFNAIQADLSNCPDLFPVLAVLCAFANGESHLMNAPQLKYKESDRIEKTFELLSRCGFSVQKKSDGLIITGDQQHTYRAKDLILFDPDGDHRMAMAAGLLMLKGFPIRLPDLNVVNKSYPQFFQHIGVSE